MKKDLLIVFLTSVCMSCSTGYTEQEFEGKWIEPIPGMPAKVQGFSLEKDGAAHSINMATLVYNSWKYSGNKLILTGKSIGNGATSDFSETWNVEKVTKDSLVVMRGNLRKCYRRSIEDCSFSGITGKRMHGTVTFADEVRTFRPKGSSEVFWLIDKSGFLNEKYRQSGAAEWSAEAELMLVETDKSAAELATSYDGVYEVLKIISISDF